MKPTDPPPPRKGPEHGDRGRIPRGAPPEASPDRYDDGVPHHHAGDHDELHNEDVAHEHSDINVRAVIMSAVIITAVVIASHILIYFTFGFLERGAAGRDPEVSPLAPSAAVMPPSTAGSPFLTETAPGVQLLTNEPMALERHRAMESERLQGYGWVDQNAGVAHIPIDEAKRLILERGLPSREFDAVDPALGTRLPAMGEASGGRVITGVLPEAAAAAAGDQPDADQSQGDDRPASESPAQKEPGSH